MSIIQTTPEQLEAIIEKCVSKAIEGQQSQSSKIYYTRKEVAELLSCDLSSISNWTKQGKLKAYGIGGRVLYKVDEIHDSLIEL
jgi:excisionase family DNA binding protein